MSDYYHYWRTRFGHIGVDKFKSHPKARFGYVRGRCLEHILRVPLTRIWTLELSTAGKTYRELVGAPKELDTIDWIIDEFDANFNALAVASLRYHQQWAVTAHHNRYEKLIARLTEKTPPMTDTDEERALINEWATSTPLGSMDCSPAVQAILDRRHLREEEWEFRQDRARHDFVDIMRELWS